MKEDNHSRKKLLFVLPALTTGGAEKVLITLMNAVDRNLYDICFLSVDNHGEMAGSIDKDIAVYSLERKLNAGALLPLYFKIKELKPDVVISTMAHMNFSLLLLKPFLKNCRFVVREAITPSFFLQKGKLKAAIVSLFYKALYPMADTVISPSQLIFDEFEELNIRLKNAVVLPNSIEEHSLRSNVKTPYQDSENGILKLVACGRLHHQKGFDRLIGHLSKIDTNQTWRLDILGEGSERGRLESLIEENGLNGNVFLRGLTTNPENYFAYCDCVLMPSRYEGMPNVVLEALACGTRVIATKESGGIKEIETGTPEGGLRIVKTMDEFLREIQRLEPLDKKKSDKSLLPDRFKRGQVLKEFHDILHDLHVSE